MLYATLASIWTVVLLVAFVLIVAWAWSRRRKKAFDEASRIPLEEDEAPPQEDKS
jgi:cytochrome c oxidase cbb3-type subunit 4